MFRAPSVPIMDIPSPTLDLILYLVRMFIISYNLSLFPLSILVTLTLCASFEIPAATGPVSMYTTSSLVMISWQRWRSDPLDLWAAFGRVHLPLFA